MMKELLKNKETADGTLQEWQKQNTLLVEKVQDLEYTLINGMLDTLDPHSILLTPEMYDDMQTSHGGFGGLGIVISIRDDELTVISPIEGTPASRQGLKAGDKIVRIGEESTVNMPLHEAVGHLRGEVGTPVEIAVMRKNWSEPRVFTIVRAHITIRSLIHHPIKKDKIAYIKIKAFEKNTGPDVRTKLREMREEMGGIDGLILDLRFNAGGLLDQAVEVADTFLAEGKTIVISEGIGGTQRKEEDARARGTEPEYPIVIIVNAGSASASEIVAGALKNHDRAVIIGDKTFGKGSVQILSDNGDGSALKLTIAQYLTPGDMSIQGVGIAPDIEVLPMLVDEEEGVDLFLSNHIRREGSLDKALRSDKVREQEEPVVTVRYLYEAPPEDATGEEFYEDFEINLARRILKGTSTYERVKLIQGTSGLLSKVGEEQDAKTVAALKKLDVNWDNNAKATKQPFEFEMHFVGGDSDKLNQVVAGQEVILHATVKNLGTKPIYQLRGITHSNNPVFDDRELLFGKVMPGDVRTWDQEITIPRGGETRTDLLAVDFGDTTGTLEKTAEIQVTSAGLDRPSYAYSYQVDDRATGNGDGQLQAGESVELLVHIRNEGVGDSEETMAFLRSESGASMFLGKGRDTVGPIPAGGVGTARLEFDAKGPKEGSDYLEFSLTVYDKDFNVRVTEVVKLPVFDKSVALNPAKGDVSVVADVPILAAGFAGSQTVAHASKGVSLQRVATTPDGALTQVKWVAEAGPDFGWITTDSLSDEHMVDDGGVVPTVTVLSAHRAPGIVFDDHALSMSDEHVEISGTIQDDHTVADYRVYLWHRDGDKIDSKKLDYGVGGRANKHFAVQVPLRTGVNRVTIIARDDEELEHSETIYIAKP